MGANTVNGMQGRPMQQFDPIGESSNKWFVKDGATADAGHSAASGALSTLAPSNAIEPSYGGINVIRKPGLGTPMGTPMINETDPQTMFRRRGGLTAGNPFGIVGQILSSAGRGRRMGGDMNEGEPYLVGEEGAEIVIPKKKSTVIPNPIVKAMFAAMQNGLGQEAAVPLGGARIPEDDRTSTPVAGFAEEVISPNAMPAEYPNANINPIQPNSDLAQSFGVGKPSMTDLLAKATQSNTASPNSFVQRPLDRELAAAESRYQDALAEDPKALNTGKGKVWRDGLIKALQIFSNVMNPQNQVPIQGWGAQRKALHLGKAGANLAPLQKLKEVEQQRALKQAQADNIYADNERQKQQAVDMAAYRTGQLAEQQAKRESVEANTKMRTVASMLAKMPSFDPNDPRMAPMVAALGDVKLPVTPRDAKKSVKLIQDAETGAWTLTLTDPVNGQQEVRPVVTKDGKPLTTTSTAKVAANASAGRQAAGFEHSERMLGLQDSYRRKHEEWQLVNKQIEAEQDQKRKLELQANAARLRDEALRIRQQISSGTELPVVGAPIQP